MSDTFGLSSRTPFAFFDPGSSSLRMSADTFPLDSMSCSVTLPPSGLMRAGVLYALPMSGPATDEPGSLSLPTPKVAADRSSRASLTRQGHWSAPALAQVVEFAMGVLPREYDSWEEVQGHHRALLPTPVAHDDGKSPEAHMAMKGRMPGGPRDQITSLSVMARQAGETGKWDSALLPTPTSRDHKGRNQRDDETCLPGAVGNLLPTPSAADGMGGHERRGGARTDELLLAGIAKDVVRTLPTPQARDGHHNRGADPERYRGSKSQNGRRSNLDDMIAATEAGRWSGEPTDPPSSDTSECSVEQLRIL